MVKDISGRLAQAVIVVESPHTDEVNTGIALSGVSGRVVSRTLIRRDTPIGPLCQDGSVHLSVVNTFSQPIKFDVKGERRPDLLRDLDSLRFNGKKDDYKNEIKQMLDATPDRGLVDDYAGRLMQALGAAEGKKIVVCGMIAQAVFEWAFKVNKARFAAPFQCQIDSVSVHVFYIWHPSPNSGEDGVSAWELPQYSWAVSALREFIGPIRIHRHR